MPRVSEAHLAARRQQILEAAWRRFAKQGFHATSMQDVFAEAGLSAGAVYRYFPSKSDLIRVTAESIRGTFDEAFDDLITKEPVPTPAEALEFIAQHVVTLAEEGTVDPTRIAITVWTEALRDPELHSIVKPILAGVRARWAELVGRWQAAGSVRADADPAQVAQLLYGTMVGFVIQRQLIGDVTPESYAAGLAALAGER